MADQADYQQAYEECQQAAIAAGALNPQGVKERMAAGILAYNGGTWTNTAVAQARLEQWTRECLRRRGFG